MQQIKEFPNSSNKPVIGISGGFNNPVCLAKVCIHENKIYVQQLTCDRLMTIEEIYDKNISIFQENKVFAQNINDSRKKAFLRQKGINVVGIDLDKKDLEYIYHNEVIAVNDNLGFDLHKSLSDFKSNPKYVNGEKQVDNIIDAIWLAVSLINQHG